MEKKEHNSLEELIAQSPGLMPYSHTVGGAVIRPDDMGKVKGKSVLAMRQQTDMQMTQLYEQIKLLAEQANRIKQRIEVSERIYSAQMSFEPLIGKVYYLYQRKDGLDTLSLIGPYEWGRSFPFAAYVAKVQLLADHTWEVEFNNNQTSD